MNKKEHYYVIAMEECSEVTKALSKTLRFGLDDSHPFSYHTNDYEILEEYYQLQAVMEWLMENGGLGSFSQDKIDDIKKTKLAKVEKYLEHSRMKGTLTEESSSPTML